MNGSHVMLDV